MVSLLSQDNLRIITFSSKKANALESAIVNELHAVLNSLEKDSECHAVLIKSEGKAVFSAGADLDEYRNGDASSVQNYLYSLGSLLCAVLFSRMPVVVGVQGKAVGGALGFIAAADYSIASNTSSFRLPELQLGLAPSVISPVLLERIGSGFLKTMSFSAAYFGSDWALSSGLVSEVVEESSLEERAEAFSKEISKRSVLPVQGYKKSLVMEKENLLKKIKEYSELNAKNIISAKNSGLFSKKS